MIVIEVQNETKNSNLPESNLLISWAQHAVSPEYKKAEICLRLVDEKESQNLNKQYRHQDKPTNVLSFSSKMPGVYQSVLLGDLVLCAPIIEKEAQEQNKIAHHHWAHMVIHGCLHLLDYNHEDDKMALVMESYEIKLLAQLGITSPYF